MTETTSRTYSLAIEVAQYIDSLPEQERSEFVSSHLRKAIKKHTKQRLLKALDDIVPIDDGDPRTSEELLDEIRHKRIN